MNIQGKKVLIVFGSLELGGAERQGLRFGRFLKESQGCRVEVWGFNSPGRSTQLCDEAGIPWKIVPLPFSGNRLQGWWRYIKFVRLMRQSRPDILLPYTTVPNVCCASASRFSGAELCIWNQRDEGLERVKPSLEQRAIHETSFFIANSSRGAEFLQCEHKVGRERIRIIRNGVELPAMAQNSSLWRKRLGLHEDTFLVCMLANFTPFKDHRTLIKAWPYVIKELATQGRSAKLVLAGDLSVTYQDMKRLTLQLGIQDSVSFPGRVDDIHGMLACADLAAFCSNSEGCPNAVLECMAAGLPIAATDIPGIREVVGDEGVQYLAPPRDERKLAQVMISFAMNPELRTIAGKANRARIAEQFGVQRMNQEMSDLINSLLRSKERRFSNGHP